MKDEYARWQFFTTDELRALESAVWVADHESQATDEQLALADQIRQVILVRTPEGR